MHHPASLFALGLSFLSPSVFAATAGSFEDGGNTLISTMMMFLGNEESIYMLDKAQSNAAQVNGHAAWGSLWDISSRTATTMDVKTNTFCSSGMHLPNGSYVTFGGNGAIGPGGQVGSQQDAFGNGLWDSTLQDFDGRKSIRVLNPCNTADLAKPECQWFDDPSVLSMQKQRWYSAAEALGDGTVVLLGGFVNGGYVNRNFPNTDPEFEGGAAECTYEFFPSNGQTPQPVQFLIKTSGLNAYAHSYLMSSGLMFVQANTSTMLWDPIKNVETPLPDMPNGVVRVYPASGAVAMLPLTPGNNYVPEMIFCGGSDMPADDYGNYTCPAIDTWNYPASKDCQRIIPEPTDGSAPVYVQDDDMFEGRTMGQFIILPNGKLLVINGGTNGTAGFAQGTGQSPTLDTMPFWESLASGPVGTPAIYDPNAPKGSRWSRDGFSSSNIARLYHSSAMLLPDASVLVAGSAPNIEVNTTAIFPTTYQAEIFYPSYFASTTRPVFTGLPNTISYGGDPFDITVSVDSYSGSANDAADNTTVVMIRGGFTTHAMNMGQRFLQLNNTYTVNSDGSLTLHVAQAPPNPNIFQPGPALVFVTINGVPSNGTMVIVGSGQVGTQPTAPASSLPVSVRLDSASGSGSGSGSSGDGSSDNGNSTDSNGAKSSTGAIIGGVVGAIAVIGILGALVGICLARRRRGAANRKAPSASYAMSDTTRGGVAAAGGSGVGIRSSNSSAFAPLQHDNYSQAWNASSASLNNAGAKGVYMDDDVPGRPSGMGMSIDIDPYAASSRMSTSTPQGYRRF